MLIDGEMVTTVIKMAPNIGPNRFRGQNITEQPKKRIQIHSLITTLYRAFRWAVESRVSFVHLYGTKMIDGKYVIEIHYD